MGSFPRSSRMCRAGGGGVDQFALVPFPSLLVLQGRPGIAGPRVDQTSAPSITQQETRIASQGVRAPNAPCSASRASFYSAGITCFCAALSSGLQSCGTAAWRFGAVSRHCYMLMLENLFPCWSHPSYPTDFTCPSVRRFFQRSLQRQPLPNDLEQQEYV